MHIEYHRYFTKAFLTLRKKHQDKVSSAINEFQKDPFAKKLRNHQLKGRLSGKRAISVTGDLRIIFQEYENYTLVIMLDVGTHNQVY